MKSLRHSSYALLGAAFFVPCIAQAQSPTPANYAALRLGTSNNDIGGLQAINPRVTSVTGTTIQNSGLTSLAVGHRYRNNWRAELEYSDRRSTNMVVSTLGAGFSGRNDLKAKSWSLMANGYYDLPLNDRFTVWGQLGLGYSRLSLGGDQSFQAPANTGAFAYGTTFPGATKSAMSWSFGLGGQAAITQQLSFDLGVRHINLGKMETKIDTVNNDERFRARLSANEIYGGLRFAF